MADDEQRRREREQELRLDLRALADQLYADHLQPSQRQWDCDACDQVRRVRRKRR